MGGKSKRRMKGKTVDLRSFLEDKNTPTGFAVVNPRRQLDCIKEENDDIYHGDRKEDKKVVLPTAPKAARVPDFDISRIPSDPPFTAYIGNLPYDIVDAEIVRFFGNLKVTSVRLPRDGGDLGRMKGFGYAEFENKQDLIEALSLNGETLKNRPVKVSLAGENENDRGDRKSDGSDRTASDWRSTPKADDLLSTQTRRSSKDNRIEDSDRVPYRGRSSFDEKNRSGDRKRDDGSKPPYQERRSNERGYGFGSNDRDCNRKYGDGGFDRNRGFAQRGEGRDDFEFRRDDRDRGYNRGGRTDRGHGYDKPREEDGSRPNDEGGRDRPKERVRLQLKPRSVPVGEQITVPTGPALTSASIFGGAKPVDTAAKESEIGLRLAKGRENHEVMSKPKTSLVDRMKEEKGIKKVALNQYREKPLKEKNPTRDNDSKERLSTESIKNSCSAAEQENREQPVTLLTNKFAHLSPQDD